METFSAERFEIIAEVGEGSYGKVFKACDSVTGEIVAIKTIEIDEASEDDIEAVKNEIKILERCKSDSITRLYGTYIENTTMYLVMEFCGGGSCSDIIRYTREPIPENCIAYIMKNALLALKNMHEISVLHRDIKGGNILLTEDGQVKLADFGVSRTVASMSGKGNTFVGTPYWMAPEVISGKGHNSACDIWSLGITSLELAEGQPPHARVHPFRALFLIPKNDAPTLKNASKHSQEFQDWLALCLVKNPSERSKINELLEHSFMKKITNNTKWRLVDLIEAANIKKENEPSEEESETESDSDDDDETSSDEDTSSEDDSDGSYDDSTVRGGDMGTFIMNNDVEDNGTLKPGHGYDSNLFTTYKDDTARGFDASTMNENEMDEKDKDMLAMWMGKQS